MKDGNKEFLGLLCSLYISALFAALPLYMGQGYWQLGNSKYALFRNITLLCLGGWLIAGMPWRLCAAKEAVKGRFQTERAETGSGGNSGRKWVLQKAEKKKGMAVSGLDLAVAAYGICVLASAVCSAYGQLAWNGYEGWFMGAFSQLLFAGIYFFVSRQYDGARWPLYLGEAALFLATVLGLLHRLGIDPLGLMEGWNSRDWEYSHMLSTLGNINWLCGYYSVALAFLAAHCLLEERVWVRAALYTAQMLALVLLGVQGSQGGLLVLAACVGTSIWLGRRQAVLLERVCTVMTGFFLLMPFMWLLMGMRGEKAAVVADGNIFDHIKWYIWLSGAAVCFGLALFFSRQKRKAQKGEGPEGKPEPGRRFDGGREKSRFAAVLGMGAAAAFLAAFCLYKNPLPDGFGSGRGFLWRISLESFKEAGWKERLLGAGPDCYGEAVFNRLGRDTEVWKDEHWEGAVFTNAHNEFLSQLCNVGILGAMSYLAVFAAGFCSVPKAAGSRKNNDGNMDAEASLGSWAGILALSMYGVYSLVSFQQVLSTPLLFATLGILEGERRRKREREQAPES